MTSTNPIWWFDDGKAGHRRQIQALIQALRRRRPITTRRLSPWTAGTQIRVWLGARRSLESRPRLLLGAGHDTHFSMLAARRATGAPCVVLMRPSLPLGCFDLCAIPAHDNPPERANVMVTDGPLSPFTPAEARDGPGLILVGGPSRHYRWDSEYVWIQIRDLVLTRPRAQWTLSTSRRTPADFLERQPRDVHDRVRVHAGAELPPAWLEEHLPPAACCVITPDSLSMVFDALSAGVPCALLDLKPRKDSRNAALLESMMNSRRVGRAGEWLAGTPLPVTPALHEAGRLADAIVARWFP